MTVCDFCGHSDKTRKVVLPIKEIQPVNAVGTAGNIISTIYVRDIVVEKEFDICDKCLSHLCDNIQASLLTKE